jgi:hypothetical protein
MVTLVALGQILVPCGLLLIKLKCPMPTQMKVNSLLKLEISSRLSITIRSLTFMTTGTTLTTPRPQMMDLLEAIVS